MYINQTDRLTRSHFSVSLIYKYVYGKKEKLIICILLLYIYKLQYCCNTFSTQTELDTGDEGSCGLNIVPLDKSNIPDVER